MLAEYALIPDIFDGTCYTSPELCRHLLGSLKEPLLNEALVRNLRGGEWYNHLAQNTALHPMAKELLKKLHSQKRLRLVDSSLPDPPDSYELWCNEALASHAADAVHPLTGIIASKELEATFKAEPLVGYIEKLSSTRWWQQRLAQGASIRLKRQTADYIKHLRLILEHANSLVFIDPHLDPTRNSYQEVHELFPIMKDRPVKPLIEIHRRWQVVDSGGSRTTVSRQEWERRFGGDFKQALNDAGLTAEVFIWDDLHDRYLITDIIGISIPNGFDISRNTDEITTWSRLGRDVRDSVSREFDRASVAHTLQYTFTI